MPSLKSTDDDRKIFAILVLLIVLACLFLSAMVKSVFISNVHIDGVYQTASAMMRLMQGDAVGKDFYFYLGLGPLYVLYPFFRFFGGDVAASILAANFLVPLAFYVSLFFYTKLVFYKYNLATTFFISIALTWTVEYLFVDYGFYLRFPDYFSYFDPGNSLRPLRRFAPVLGAILLYAAGRAQSATKRITFYGVVAGVIANWSNDYGLPTAFAAFLFVWWEAYIQRKSAVGWVVDSAQFTLVALLVFFLVVGVSTLGSVTNWLSYNFQGVSGDQWWYYKPYIKDRVWSLSEMYLLFDRGGNWTLQWSIILGSIAVPTMLAAALIRRSRRLLTFAYIGVGCYGGAFISEVFGHRDDYYWAGFIPWIFFCGLMLVSLAIRAISGRMQGYIDPRVIVSSFRYLAMFSVAAILLVSMLKLIVLVQEYQSTMHRAGVEGDYQEALGGYVRKENDTVRYLNYIRSLLTEDVGFSEEYFGLASALKIAESPVPFDSVIHALGGASRALYLDSLSETDYLTTTSPEFSRWQSWSFSQNWWFYRYVLANFEAIKQFDNVVVWKRRGEIELVNGGPVYSCSVVSDDGRQMLVVDEKLNSESLVEISVDFELHFVSGERNLILVENGLSHHNMYTSINPSVSSASFPVLLLDKFISSGIPVHLMPVRGVSRKSILYLRSCRVSLIENVSTEVYVDRRFTPLPEVELEYFTDGLHNALPIFHVVNSREHIEAYMPGRQILFANGDVRSVVAATENPWADLLVVEYSGESLANAAVGFPNRIRVIED